MARTARKIIPLHEEKTLEEKIAEAGQLNAEANRLKGAYEKMRADILTMMPPIGDNYKSPEVVGGGFVACVEVAEKTTVDLHSLLDNHPDLFWRLIKIPVGDLEKSLSRGEFRDVTVVERAEKPTLSIRKIKVEK